MGRRVKMQEPTEETTSDDIISVMNDYALIKDCPPPKFVSIADLMEKVRVQDQSQYPTFGQVNPDDCHSPQKYRDEHGPKLLFTYFSPIETLIIKIPNAPHECLHWSFGFLLHKSVINMGMGMLGFWGTGSNRYRSRCHLPSQSFSEKEGDSTYRNMALRPNDYSDWPHLVIEAGESESISRLQADARWWIENSNGQVRMVLLLNIDTKKRTIRILKYISIPPSLSSSHSIHQYHRAAAVPSLTADVFMDYSVTPARIQGTPLTLEFDRMFGRSPNPPLEGNIALTATTLDDWAMCI